MSSSQAYHLFPPKSQEPPHTAQVMALSLLQDFQRLAQENPDHNHNLQRQLVDGYIRDIRAAQTSTGQLARLYFEQGLSSGEIGKQVGISGGAVRARLRRAGYTLRRAVPIDELARLYFDELLSSSEIAERVNLSAAEVLRRLRGTGRKMRTGSESHKLWQRKKRQELTPEQLQECQLAPAYEAQHGIADYVICRICGVFSKSALTAKTGHFAVHHPGMSKDEYFKLFPHAPLYSCLHTAKYTRMRDGRKLDVLTVMQRRAGAYVTGDELRQYRSNNDWEEERGIEDFVVCRECGKKITLNLAGGAHGHLTTHGWKNVEEYHRKWPGAPTVPPRVAGKRQKQWQAKQQKAWRPDDWDDWDAEQQIVGLMLIENPRLKPREVGIRLDESRLACIWAEKSGSWERHFTTPGTGRNWYDRVRKRVQQNPFLTK